MADISDDVVPVVIVSEPVTEPLVAVSSGESDAEVTTSASNQASSERATRGLPESAT